jgi:predicted DNA-binding transcriptional regulator AlpA
MDTETRLYRIWEVIGNPKLGISGIVPMCKASWYAGMKDGRYPKPVKLSERSVAWRKTDIDALVARLSSGKWQGESHTDAA